MNFYNAQFAPLYDCSQRLIQMMPCRVFPGMIVIYPCITNERKLSHMSEIEKVQAQQTPELKEPWLKKFKIGRAHV